MKTGKKFLLAVMLFAAVGISSSLFAFEAVTNGIDGDVGVQPYGLEEPAGYENYWNCISRKLGRGISNAAFGAFEVVIRISEVRFEEGGIAGVTYGAINGVGYFIAREVIGVLEVATFFAPLPFTPNDPVRGKGWGYGPIITPEWVLTPDKDLWNVVYTDTTYNR